PGRVGCPASLLRADAQVVPFAGREQILAELQEWCAAPWGFGVRVLTGPGGQGKTRLARELAGRMGAAGWVAGLVTDTTIDAEVVAGLASVSCPVLLVVDYAETRGGQGRQLAEALPGGGGPPGRPLP